MVGREEMPNAVDAIILCDYLGVRVEDVFSEDAEKKLGRPLLKRHKALSPNAAGEMALAEATETARRLPRRNVVKRDRGKDRKTG